VTRNDRKVRIWQLAVNDMQIGAADAARCDLDQDFAGRRNALRPRARASVMGTVGGAEIDVRVPVP